MKYKRLLFFYLLFFIGTSLAFGFGYLIRAIQEQTVESMFPVLEQAYQILDSTAYDDLPVKKTFEYGMIHRMMEIYGDPYSRFEEPATHELNTNQLEGKYGGIGASLELGQDGRFVVHPFPDGPAELAGVTSGDVIIQIDHWQLPPNADLSEVLAAIRGPEGEIVKILIWRPSEETEFSFQISRKDYPIPSVTWYLVSDAPWFGVVKINIMAATTPDEIQVAIDELRTQGVTYLALDLRDNRGGYLNAGIDTSRLFLETGTIIQEHYRDQDITTYEVKRPGAYAQLPIVVFVNNNTASAAEIIAGALKAHGRATVYGSPTFGKDSIQLIFDLMDNSSLHVTAAKWWVPGLEPPIGEGGLLPDVYIDADAEGPDPYVQAALRDIMEEK
jgi:carboxyl-terminal processing protease